MPSSSLSGRCPARGQQRLSFGKSYGVVIGVLATLGVPMTLSRRRCGSAPYKFRQPRTALGRARRSSCRLRRHTGPCEARRARRSGSDRHLRAAHAGRPLTGCLKQKSPARGKRSGLTSWWRKSARALDEVPSSRASATIAFKLVSRNATLNAPLPGKNLAPVVRRPTGARFQGEYRVNGPVDRRFP